MDLPNEDLEEYVEKFEKVFSNQKLNKKNQCELLLLIENISSELHICKKSENNLRINLKKLTENESFNLNQKYYELKEKCHELENTNKLLEDQKEELKFLKQNELETQKNDYLNQIKDIEQKTQSEIINLKNQLESNRICFEAKEKELYNDLQMSQAASSLEWDLKETNLRRELQDAKNNLRQTQSNVCRLRCEVNQLRNQLSLQKTAAQNNTLYFQETPIQQIKSRLVQKQNINERNNSEGFEYNQLELNREHSISLLKEDIPNTNNLYYNISDETHSINISARNNLQQTDKSTNEIIEENKISDENRPSSSLSSATTINIYKSVQCETFEPKMVETQVFPNIYTGSFSRYSKNKLPPLKPCTNVQNTKQEKKQEISRKKRKLYNPDNSII